MNKLIRYTFTAIVLLGLLYFGQQSVHNIKHIGFDFPKITAGTKSSPTTNEIIATIREKSKRLNELKGMMNSIDRASLQEMINEAIAQAEKENDRALKKILLEAKAKECRELGIASENTDCNVQEKLLDDLKQASFFYNKPSKMMVGEWADITLSLNPSDPAAAKKTLERIKGEAKERKSKIARHMSAELIGTSFEIEPSGLQQRLVISSNTTTWKWKVNPIKEGKEELLTLDVYAHFEVDGKTTPPVTIKTFREKILVEITPWNAVKKMAADWSPAITLLFATVGTLWGLYVWYHRKEWRLTDSQSKAAKKGKKKNKKHKDNA